MKDHYEILGLPPRATEFSEIYAAYLAKAKEHHPDKGGTQDAMAAVTEAYKTIADPAKRKIYDGALQVSGRFPVLCPVCEGLGRRKKGMSNWTPCKKCNQTGRA